MSEHQHSPQEQPSSAIDFDMADLSEPTPETLEKLEELMDALRILTEQSEHGEVTKIDLNENPDTPPIGELTNFFYMRHPTNEEISSFKAEINDMTPETREALSEEGSPFAKVASLFIQTPNKSFEYEHPYNQNPTLYIQTKANHVPREGSETGKISAEGAGISMSIAGSPQFMRALHAKIEERDEAARLGLDKPTDGTMKELIAAIEAELQRPVQPAA